MEVTGEVGKQRMVNRYGYLNRSSSARRVNSPTSFFFSWALQNICFQIFRLAITSETGKLHTKQKPVSLINVSIVSKMTGYGPVVRSNTLCKYNA